MRFAFFFPERSKGIFWSGPYQVPANSITEAKDLLTDVILKRVRDDSSQLHGIRLLEVENRVKPGRAEEHYAEVSVGLKDEIWRRSMWEQFPDGVPKPQIRSLDAQWDC